MASAQPGDIQLPDSAVAALALGRKIEAIKIVRDVNGLGLKEAKDLVDKYLECHPNLPSGGKAASHASLRGCLLLFLLVAAFVAIWFFAGPARS